VSIGAGVGVPNLGTAAYVTIDASGTSNFTGGLVTTGPSNAPARLSVYQFVTIAGTALNAPAGTNIRFPANSMLVDALAIIRVGASGAAAGGNTAASIWVGTSANEGSYLRMAVSASGYYGMGRVGGVTVCAANALNTGANGSEVYISVNVQTTTAGSDASTLEGVLMLNFVRRA